ncbi:ATP-binding cassette domain-containing protein [Corynebacterium sp. P3-F1]|uniref:ABC transporter ATP-binding protein n=1 Tax=Corynebacterium sp. P3-F1 TaxID=3059080 RepID=UPI00265D56B6|nr:ATP-binding cassette domain-containing protein [Corynebacterium sp. P3-F1]WKK60566.1 ATP-binding cassette domain-containing protein [Corynebacterium sp. P3-F1]
MTTVTDTRRTSQSTSGRAPALSMKNVTVTFSDGDGRITALDNASLTAEPRTVTFVVGASGSGKSTLLSAAAGLLTPDSGTVEIAGEPISDDVRLNHVGMVFQQPNLIASLTVRDQLLVTEHIRGTRGRELGAKKSHADDLLELVGLEGLGDRRMQQLSGGQRQRVGIARALMGVPSLVLADEPTAALDTNRSQEIITLLRNVTEEIGPACLIVTHETELIEDGDRVIQVSDGHVTEG